MIQSEDNMETNIQNLCPKCKAEISEANYFCPNCGQVLKSRPADTGIPKQILIYLVSFFLAPFGLGYVFTYLRQPDKKARIIGIVALTLTILAIGLTIFLAKGFLDFQYGTINALLGGPMRY